jgi:hypothetical protein
MDGAQPERSRLLAPIGLVVGLALVGVVLGLWLGGGDESARRPAPVPTASPEPDPTPAPEPAGPVVGLVAGGIDVLPSADAMARLGARHARVEFEIGSPVEALRPVIGGLADRGIQVLVLAGFHGRLPDAEEARSLAAWAREFGPGGPFWAERDDAHLAIDTIEFGNETSYTHQGTQNRGGEYAERFRDAHDALRASDGNPRVGLLAQADDADTERDAWVDSMFDAVPDLAERVAGWTIHPYGPDWEDRVGRLVDQTAANGAGDDIPVHVTEWGVTTDDGRCLSDNYGWDPCMSFQAAADTLRETTRGLSERLGDRLASVFLFQATDQRDPGVSGDREHYFGALRRDLSDKGAYSAEVRAILAGSLATGAE